MTCIVMLPSMEFITRGLAMPDTMPKNGIHRQFFQNRIITQESGLGVATRFPDVPPGHFEYRDLFLKSHTKSFIVVEVMFINNDDNAVRSDTVTSRENVILLLRRFSLSITQTTKLSFIILGNNSHVLTIYITNDHTVLLCRFEICLQCAKIY